MGADHISGFLSSPASIDLSKHLIRKSTNENNPFLAGAVTTCFFGWLLAYWPCSPALHAVRLEFVARALPVTCDSVPHAALFRARTPGGALPQVKQLSRPPTASALPAAAVSLARAPPAGPLMWPQLRCAGCRPHCTLGTAGHPQGPSPWGSGKQRAV